MKKEYRCTRPDLYTHDCPARTDVSGRQGHYVVVLSEADAHRIMRKRFPHDSHFDVAVWKDVPDFVAVHTQ